MKAMNRTNLFSLVRLASLMFAATLIAPYAFSAVDNTYGVQQLAAQAGDEGMVRVIVVFREDEVPGAVSAQMIPVDVEDGIATLQDRLLERIHGLRHGDPSRFRLVPGMALEVGTDALWALANSPEVAAVVEDQQVEPTLRESTRIIGAPAVWSTGATGAGQAVAILDTGVDRDHPFLRGRVVEEACFSSSTSTTSTLCPNGSTTQYGAGAARPCPACQHGTHVAGIAAGAGSSFNGVAPGAWIIAVQIFSYNVSTGTVTAFGSDIIRGLEYVYSLRGRLNIAAANLSLGGGQYFSNCDANDLAKPVIDRLLAAGTATVVAAGNNGFSDSVSWPACISSAVTVGSSTKQDGISSFSNGGAMVDLLAPGSGPATAGIYSSIPGGGYTYMQGTSMATPHVVGALALLRSAYPTRSTSELVSTLQISGRAIFDARNGRTFSRISVDTAMRSLGMSQPDAYEPDDVPAQARVIALNSTQTGRSLHRVGDRDWVTFTVAGKKPKRIAIDTRGASGDTVMYLYSEDGTLIAQDDDSGDGNFSHIEARLRRGRYYIVVTEFNEDGKVESYDLSVTKAPTR